MEFERGKRLEDKGHSLFGFDMSIIAVLAGLFTVGQTLTSGTGIGIFSYVLAVYALAVCLFVIATLFTMACFRVTIFKHSYGPTSLDELENEFKKSENEFKDDRLKDLVDSFASTKKENDSKSTWLRIAQYINVVAIIVLAISIVLTITILGGWL
jgi:hypothetical protein